MKKCPKCLKTLELTEFPPRKGGKFGVRNRCRSCTKLYQKSHKLTNINYIRAYWRKYRKHRLATDVNFKLSVWIRKTASRFAFKKPMKTSKALGCSVADLRLHLESKFQKGMTWQNYGDWHIDHIIPLSSFNLENKNQFSKACHYSNLQPLWAIDNIKKGNSF